MIKAKILILLTFDDSFITQTSAIIDDDDCTAKESRDASDKLYATFNAHTKSNLHSKLENLV